MGAVSTLWRRVSQLLAYTLHLPGEKHRIPSVAVLRPAGPPAIPWTSSPVPEGVEVVPDVSPARWLVQSVEKWPWATVGSLLPDAFDAYARILHPPYMKTESGQAQPLRWAAVAEWTGATVHPLMQFARIARLSDDPNEQPSWGHRPREGTLEGDDLLAAILRRFTSTPERCWYCLWEGFGGLDMVPALIEAPRVEIPGRAYLLFCGSLDAQRSFSTSGAPWGESPNIWWPDDRAWCVATDIDLESTYVGGSRRCIEEVVASTQLEAYPARLDDRVDVGADSINV